MKGPKTSLSKFEKIEIIPTIFFGQNSMKLEINKRKDGKPTNMWKPKKKTTSKQCKNQIIFKKLNYLKTNENGNKINQILWHRWQAQGPQAESSPPL